MINYNTPLQDFFKEELRAGKKIKWVRKGIKK